MPLLERQGDNDIAVIEAILLPPSSSFSSSSASVLSFCVIPKDEDEVFPPFALSSVPRTTGLDWTLPSRPVFQNLKRSGLDRPIYYQTLKNTAFPGPIPRTKY